MDSVLTVLLAGGKGTRLDPLTRDRAKPAVPFAGMYRIVDFALSKCINSRLFNILANGTVCGGWVRGSVVGFDCRIGAGAVVEGSILFDRDVVGPGRRCGGRSWTRECGSRRARGSGSTRKRTGPEGSR